MSEAGFVRFPGSLDPGAEEFRPRNPNQLVFFRPQLSLPLPPPPPPHQVYYNPYPPQQINEVVVPYPTPAAYVSTVAVQAAPIPPPAGGPTRAVLLKSVPCDVAEGAIRREVEAFGEVRWVQMERVGCDGIVTVHFYDLRHAEKFLTEIREHNNNMHHRRSSSSHNHHQRHLAANAGIPYFPVLFGSNDVWAHFVIPVHTAIPEGHNQGTIVIFNLDRTVTTATLREIFQVFGPVKELRETPMKKHQKFVEFFDVRDAARALQEMNGREIHGKPLVIEFSRPGGSSWRKLNSLTTITTTTAPTLVSTNIAAAELFPPPPQELPQAYSGHSRYSVVPPRLYGSPPHQFFTRPVKGYGNVAVESQMADLSLGIVNVEEREPVGHSKRQGQAAVITSPRLQVEQQPPPQKSSRGKKTKQMRNKLDTRFLINVDIMAESPSGDLRTTLMIKNIPNKYSQKLLLSMLDNHCIHCNEQIIRDSGDGDEPHQPFSSYDFVYLPIDFNNKCNVGYGFVNMTSPEATWRLYKAFHHQNWEVFNSRKICEVTYARVQGLEALKEHFKNSKFPSEMDDYLPVVFSPPRDGKRLTDPNPIMGKSSSSSSAITHPITLLLPTSHRHNNSHGSMDSDHRNGGVLALHRHHHHDDNNDDQDDQDS